MGVYVCMYVQSNSGKAEEIFIKFYTYFLFFLFGVTALLITLFQFSQFFYLLHPVLHSKFIQAHYYTIHPY